MKLFDSNHIHETGEAHGTQRNSYLQCAFPTMMHQQRKLFAEAGR